MTSRSDESMTSHEEMTSRMNLRMEGSFLWVEASASYHVVVDASKHDEVSMDVTTANRVTIFCI